VAPYGRGRHDFRDVKEHKPEHADEAADHRIDDRGSEKSEYTTQPIEIERRAAETLDEGENDKRTTGIRHDEKQGAGKVAIAEQIDRESGSGHADRDRPPRGRTQRQQKSGGYACSRPEHRDAIRFLNQSKTKTRGKEERDRDSDANDP